MPVTLTPRARPTVNARLTRTSGVGPKTLEGLDVRFRN